MNEEAIKKKRLKQKISEAEFRGKKMKGKEKKYASRKTRREMEERGRGREKGEGKKWNGERGRKETKTEEVIQTPELRK